MSGYLSEIYTHPIWMICVVGFLWRIVLSFRKPFDLKEIAIVIALFLLTVAVTPNPDVIINTIVPFYRDFPVSIALGDKLVYWVMNVLVFPIAFARVGNVGYCMAKNSKGVFRFIYGLGTFFCAGIAYFTLMKGVDIFFL
jgi:hypothetical protein